MAKPKLPALQPQAIMSLSAIFHHVRTVMPPELSDVDVREDIMSAWREGRLPLCACRCEWQDGKRGHPHLVAISPDNQFSKLDWSASRATQSIGSTALREMGLVEFIDIGGYGADVLELWPVANTVNGSNRGRKPLPEWDDIQVICILRFDQDGVPDNLSAFARELLDEWEKRFSQTAAPEEDTMRKHVARWAEAFARVRRAG